MYKTLVLAIALLLAMPAIAQQKKGSNKTNKPATEQSIADQGDALKKVYNEELNPMEQIDQALEEARNTNRLVVCQVGGNWCPWCLRFAHFITSDQEINDLINKHFIYIHLNTSKEHKNADMLKRLGNPGRFGYPVLVILGKEGEVLHIQNSAYLEEGKSYDRKKVLEFFQNWTIEAIENIK